MPICLDKHLLDELSYQLPRIWVGNCSVVRHAKFVICLRTHVNEKQSCSMLFTGRGPF